jgi:hypothetical protein
MISLQNCEMDFVKYAAGDIHSYTKLRFSRDLAAKPIAHSAAFFP